MSTAQLLVKLIDIARIPKTDFALNMHMTPSGLSKILTGKRLPNLKEKKNFSRKAALYLADVIYDYHCHLKLDKVFPVIYDFSSKYELEFFLMSAIEYSMDKDFWEENSENKDYPDTETSYLGQKTVLNMVCIILSDQIVNTKEESLEFYSTIPILTPIHFNSFSKIQSVNLRNWKILSMNHFIDSSSISPIFDKYGMKFLSAIPKLHQFAKLDLWITEEKIESDFILLKDRILLVFNVMMDGSLLLTTIRHKGYLNRFFTNFMKKKIKKISYSHAEAIAFLEKKPAFIDDLLSKGIDTVYNFITLGYLLKRQELDTLEGSDRIKDLLFKLFHNILTSDTNFLLTLDSLTQFFATGKALVPLLGPFDFPQEERISYLERFNLYLNGEKSDKVRILNCELPNLSILCLPGINIVYYADDTYQSERFYYFESDSLNNLLKKEISEDDLKTLDFNGEMWNYCIEELRTNVHPWVY